MSDQRQFIEKDGRFYLMVGTRCSQESCQFFECDFPNCAKVEGGSFASFDDVKKKYPSAELVS